MAKRMGYKAIFGCESSRYSVQKQVIAIAKCQRAKISPKSAPFNLFRNVMKYSKWWKIDWTQFNCISENYLENSANSEQGAQIHQPTGRPVPHTCAQLQATVSHLLALTSMAKPLGYWTGKTRVSKILYCRGECKAVYQVPAQHNTCGSSLLGTAELFSHDLRGEGGSWVWCMCAPCFKFVFWKQWTKLFYCIKNLKSPLDIAIFFEILKLAFLSGVAHKSFCVKFSGLIRNLKILEKSY